MVAVAGHRWADRGSSDGPDSAHALRTLPPISSTRCPRVDSVHTHTLHARELTRGSATLRSAMRMSATAQRSDRISGVSISDSQGSTARVTATGRR
jgi:hypothetical protein